MINYYPKEKIFSFDKGFNNEEVRFALSETKGKICADIRVYMVEADGAKMATHKGIFLDAEKLPDFREGIDQLIEAARAKKGK